jgi:hypothetical protein
MSETDPVKIIRGIDCSPEAQDLRRKRLAELEGIFYGGTASLADRNRSVTFASRADLGAAIVALHKQIDVCMGAGWPRRESRIYYVPQVKGL